MQILLSRASLNDLSTFLNIEESVRSPINRAITDTHEAARIIHEHDAYMIKVDGESVGLIVYINKGCGHFYLREFAIYPSAQKNGIGRQALSIILGEHLKEAEEISLHTHPQNERALSLYRSMGFQVKECQYDLFEDSEPRLYLVKTENSPEQLAASP